MKKYAFILILFIVRTGYAQTTNDILNVLVQRKLIAQEEADSLRADAAIKQQDSDAKRKSFSLNAGKVLSLSGFTQIRYQNLEQSGKKSGFDIRRARLNIKGNISPYFGYMLQPEFDGASAKLLDAFAEVKLANYFNLTIGQQKVALSRESQEADTKYDFVDRSQIVQALVARTSDVIGDQNARDIGLQANGSLLTRGDVSLVEYWVGLFNGAGINATENNTSKDIAARLLIHPISGLDLGGSFYNGVGYYGTPTAKNHGRNRWGLELKYELQNFTFQSEYLKGKDALTNKEGYYIEAGYYILPKKLQLIAKYDVIDPDQSKGSDISYWYVTGANYSFNPNTRLQLAYTVKKKQGGSQHSNVAVAQFLIGF